jgi:MerR family transcriptional regulator, light-induced transcriptional regulator
VDDSGGDWGQVELVLGNVVIRARKRPTSAKLQRLLENSSSCWNEVSSDKSSRHSPYGYCLMNLLTTKQVASLLGVGISTVKRLCNSGELPECRTPGGHRRIPADAVLALVDNGSKLASIASVRDQVISLEPSTVLELLLSGDVYSLRKSLEQLLESNPLTLVFDQVLAPALWLLGRNCTSGTMEAFQCFVASSRLSEIFAWLRENVVQKMAIQQLKCPLPSRKIAIGACLHDEQHSFPSLMTEMTLMEIGYETIQLGCCVPVESLIRAVIQTNADLVWVSYSMCENLPMLVHNNHRLFEALPSHSRLFVGGASLTAHVRSLMRFTLFSESMTHLRQQLLQWNATLGERRQAA